MKSDKNLSTSGTCLQGYIEADHKLLVKLFGKSHNHDDYKSDAEWYLDTPYGIATIYNYKDGKNYLGDEGDAIEDITEWHIGGTNKNVSAYLQGFIHANQK